MSSLGKEIAPVIDWQPENALEPILVQSEKSMLGLRFTQPENALYPIATGLSVAFMVVSPLQLQSALYPMFVIVPAKDKVVSDDKLQKYSGTLLTEVDFTTMLSRLEQLANAQEGDARDHDAGMMPPSIVDTPSPYTTERKLVQPANTLLPTRRLSPSISTLSNPVQFERA